MINIHTQNNMRRGQDCKGEKPATGDVSIADVQWRKGQNSHEYE